MTTCSHVDQIQDVRPRSEGCEECLQTGDRWVQLRACMVCGHVGCCDSSKNKHATAHFHQTQHPVMRAFKAGEDWAWCYVDSDYLDPIPQVHAA
ncbi:MAG: ubiquitin carboxyl-terminal hydrolase 14 [Terriglobales bacterium]